MTKIALQLICLAALSAAPLQAAPTTLPSADASATVLEASTMAIAHKCVSATVGLVSTVQAGNRVSVDSGSGVIISADGLILTAGHVIEKPGNKMTVRFADGRVVNGVAVGLDHLTDTGLARITDPAPAGGWAFCTMAPDDSATPGQWVLATGNPGSIIVDRDPPLRLGRVSGHSTDAIRTNCAIEPGDSGGPLFDLAGQVVGINSRIYLSDNDSPLLDYRSTHVPISDFSREWKDLLAGMNANPDVNLDSRYQRPRPNPGLGAGARAALNALAAQNDPDAIQALADEKKNKKLSIKPEMMARLLKLAAANDRANNHADNHAGIKPVTMPGQTPDATASAIPTPPPRIRPVTMERTLISAGKTSRQTLALFASSVDSAGDCTVQIRAGDQRVLLGTVVDSDGWIVTKSSDLPPRPKVVLPNGDVMDAILIGRDRVTDLALLKISTTGLTAVKFTDSAPLGEWLAAPTGNSDLLAIGLVSLTARPIGQAFSHFEGEQRIVLGVGFSFASPVITTIMHGMPAEAIGMKAGDEVFQLNGQPVTDHDSFVDELKKAKPGDTLSIMVHRDGKDLEFKPIIGAVRATTQTVDGIGEADNVAGGKLSRRRTSFPMAIQTDVAIWGDECGGPLLNLQGQAVGIVIARYDRVCTFALPAELVESTVKKLKKTG